MMEDSNSIAIELEKILNINTKLVDYMNKLENRINLIGDVTLALGKRISNIEDSLK